MLVWLGFAGEFDPLVPRRRWPPAKMDFPPDVTISSRCLFHRYATLWVNELTFSNVRGLDLNPFWSSMKMEAICQTTFLGDPM